MKVTCDREKLLVAFQTAATVVPTRSPKPILQNVKLETVEQGGILMATDMDNGIRIDVPSLEVEVPGSAVLPVSRFASILRESSDEKLSLEADSQYTVVRGTGSEFRLQAANPDEFPNVATFAEEKFIELPARLLKQLIHRTVFAADTESSRYALGGVLLEIEADKVIGVATDGRRLAKMEGPAQSVGGPPTADWMTIVPSRAMQLIDRVVSDDDAEIQLATQPSAILVKTPRATIYARLVEGRFPKWREVIPNRPDAIQFEMAIGPLHTAVRQAAVVASEESRGIDLVFGEGTLLLKGSTAEVGDTRVELPIPYDGEKITVTIDYRFLADFLKVLDPDKTFTIEIKDSEGAIRCTTGDGYDYVVMPLSQDR